MAEKLRTGNFGGFSKKKLSDKLINKGKESTNKDLEKLKEEKAAKTIENKKEVVKEPKTAPVETLPKEAVPPVVNEPPKEPKTASVDVSSKEEVKASVVNQKELEKESTSISLDKDVLMKMKLYCKANKLSLSGEINNYLKNQYIPKRKVNEFLKNMFS